VGITGILGISVQNFTQRFTPRTKPIRTATFQANLNHKDTVTWFDRRPVRINQSRDRCTAWNVKIKNDIQGKQCFFYILVWFNDFKSLSSFLTKKVVGKSEIEEPAKLRGKVNIW